MDNMDNQENKELTLDEMVIKTREVFSEQIVFELEKDPSLTPHDLQKLIYENLKSRLDILQETNEDKEMKLNADDFILPERKTPSFSTGM